MQATSNLNALEAQSHALSSRLDRALHNHAQRRTDGSAADTYERACGNPGHGYRSYPAYGYGGGYPPAYGVGGFGGYNGYGGFGRYGNAGTGSPLSYSLEFLMVSDAVFFTSSSWH